MAKIKMIPKLIHFSEKQIKMVDVLLEGSSGYTSFSEVIRAGLNDLYERKGIKKDYNKDPLETPKTVIDRAILKSQAKEETRKKELEMQIAHEAQYCVQVMRGEVVGETCHYKQWGAKPSDDSNEVCPLHFLGDIITEKDCFFPDKDTVMTYRKDVKKLYEKN